MYTPRALAPIRLTLYPHARTHTHTNTHHAHSHTQCHSFSRACGAGDKVCVRICIRGVNPCPVSAHVSKLTPHFVFVTEPSYCYRFDIKTRTQPRTKTRRLVTRARSTHCTDTRAHPRTVQREYMLTLAHAHACTDFFASSEGALRAWSGFRCGVYVCMYMRTFVYVCICVCWYRVNPLVCACMHVCVCVTCKTLPFVYVRA